MTELLIRGRTFQQPVRIQNWADPRPLIFDKCRFEGGFSALGAKIDRGIVFIDCAFKPLEKCAGCKDIALDFSTARIHGDLVLFNCKLEGRLFALGLKAESNVRLQGCRIVPAGWFVGGAIKADRVLDQGVEDHLDSCFKPKDGDKGQDTSLVVFDGARIGGHFEIASAGDELARRASANETPANDHEFASVIAGRVSCERIEVEGNITLSDSIIFGPVSFEACAVSGSLILERTLLRNPEQWDHNCLCVDQARIARNVGLNYVDVQGAVSLYGAAVRGFCDVLGLRCAGNLNLNFLTSTYLSAYRDRGTTNIFGGRKSLHVGNDLLLSGAKIGMVELRAARIDRNVRAQTGEFGTFTLGWGIEPRRNNFWLAPCVARAISFTSIDIRETLDMGGIKVGEAYLKAHNGKRNDACPESHGTWQKNDRHGIELLNSQIAGALVFFMGDKLVNRLERRWGGSIVWDSMFPLKSNAFSSEIIGDLIVRACRIGGDLDLRNVHLKGGGIFLGDTNVGLRLKAGSESQSSLMVAVSDLETRCLYLGGKKLSCQDDVDLMGIRVGERFAQPANGISEVKARQLGDVSLRAAQITGDLLLAKKDKDSGLPPKLEPHAVITGKLDLSSVHCEKLVLSGKSFVRSEEDHSAGALRAILARGHFSQVEIFDWTTPSPIFRAWTFIGEILKSIWKEILIWPRVKALRSGLAGAWDFFWSVFKSTPRPIDLRHITVDSWILGSQGRESARKYVRILKEMDPEDRSTWLGVESDLRNQSFEWQADRVYLAMVRSSQRRLREKWSLLRLPIFLWHLLSYLVQECFLFVKAFFVVPLVFACVTVIWLSCLFSNPRNVRASVGFLHALPESVREANPTLEISPSPAEWHRADAVALALRYHIPLFETRTHDRWEASSRELHLGIGRISFPRGIRMETIAFIVEVIYWAALPILLLGFAAWAFRKRNTD